MEGLVRPQVVETKGKLESSGFIYPESLHSEYVHVSGGHVVLVDSLVGRVVAGEHGCGLLGWPLDRTDGLVWDSTRAQDYLVLWDAGSTLGTISTVCTFHWITIRTSLDCISPPSLHTCSRLLFEGPQDIDGHAEGEVEPVLPVHRHVVQLSGAGELWLRHLWTG